MHLNSKIQVRFHLRVIMAIVAIAEREGGFEHIDYCVGKRTWHDSICGGLLWYNARIKSDKTGKYYETTRAVRI